MMPFVLQVIRRVAASAALFACCSGSAQTASPPAYRNQTLQPEARARDLVSRMTLEEKASQMVNGAAAIERLGVPAYDFWSEGLHGVARSGYATQFPQAIGMAATWDEPLLQEIGRAISTEARAKYNDAIAHDVHSIYYGLTIWSPNINIFRDPRWGRGQETYGEDPFLTARLGTAFVRGIQGDDPRYFRAIATPKHFAVHSGPESERHSMNVSPSEHDLWDTYLPAFRATVVEGKADSVMCAYNAVFGDPACGSKRLLETILREDWGFRGFVTSDCAAIDDFYLQRGHHFSADQASAAAAGIKAGTDTNCGSTYLDLVEAVKRGLITEKEIDVSLVRLFEARMRLGMFDDSATMPYGRLGMEQVRSADHVALALKTARESIVMLKNDHGALPLASGVTSIAVVGPNASALAALEGNYSAIAREPVLPIDAVSAMFPAAKITYAQGAPYVDGLPVPMVRTHFHVPGEGNEEGLRGEYFANDRLEGTPVVTRTDKQIDFDWSGASPAPGVPEKAFSVRWSGTIRMPAPGDYAVTARLAPCYPCADYVGLKLWLDGTQVDTFAVEKKFRGSETPVVTLHFADTKPHAFKIEYVHRTELFGAGFTLEWTPTTKPLLDQAVEAAKQSDVVVAFVGLSPGLEGEQMPINVPGFRGGDRTDLGLPASQQAMLEAVKATGKPLVVVLMNGSALAVTWAQKNADAILEAWYPGEAGGRAIAETLAGKNNPAGRLPVTFYADIAQLPAFDDYGMANRTYRYFKGKPLYGFGYGLSFTHFTYANVRVSSEVLDAGAPLIVTADVTNTGSAEGEEVAQAYLLPPRTVLSPELALEGFQRLRLGAGETKRLSFTLDARQLSSVDVHGTRAVVGGDYRISIGGGQPGSGSVTASFRIRGDRQLPR